MVRNVFKPVERPLTCRGASAARARPPRAACATAASAWPAAAAAAHPAPPAARRRPPTPSAAAAPRVAAAAPRAPSLRARPVRHGSPSLLTRQPLRTEVVVHVQAVVGVVAVVEPGRPLLQQQAVAAVRQPQRAAQAGRLFQRVALLGNVDRLLQPYRDVSEPATTFDHSCACGN